MLFLSGVGVCNRKNLEAKHLGLGKLPQPYVAPAARNLTLKTQHPAKPQVVLKCVSHAQNPQTPNKLNPKP